MNSEQEKILLNDTIKEELDRRVVRFIRREGKSFTLKAAKIIWAKKRKQNTGT